MSEVDVKKEVNNEDDLVKDASEEANSVITESQAEAGNLNENLISEAQTCANVVEKDGEETTTMAEPSSNTCTESCEPNAKEPQQEIEMQNAAMGPQVSVKTEPSELSTAAAPQEEQNNSVSTTTAIPTTTTDESLATDEVASEEQNEANLQVKAEPIAEATDPDEQEALPEDFFDDLLMNAEAIREATRSVEKPSTPEPVTENLKPQDAANTTPTANPEVPIKTENAALAEGMEQGEIADDDDDMPTENFFDDLLVDRMAARLADVANVANEEMEIKYSEKLKELRQKLSELEAESSLEQSKDKSHKKHKKSKKKSHKRSREERKSASKERSPTNSGERRRKRSRASPNGSASPSGSINGLPRIKVKKEKDLYTTKTSNLLRTNTQAAEHGIYEAADMPSTSAAAAAQVNTPPKRLMVKAEFRNFNSFVDNKRTATTSTTTATAGNDFYDDVDDEDELVECLPVQLPSALFSRRNEAASGFAVPLTKTFTGLKRIKLEKPTIQNNIIPATIDFSNDLWQSLTPKMKREKAVERAGAVIVEFKKAERLNATNFLYTATVRKLPTSSSYVQQQIYENRSPLHTINNVNFKFNSYGTRINLHDWGIEAIPSKAANVAKILGYNADTLHAKRKTIKLPIKLQKVKVEKDASCGEVIDETNSTFFTNAMTQTNEVTVIAGRRHMGHSIGIQTIVQCGEIATQTTETGQTTRSSNDDLPLMRLMNELNENQLMALQDFAELMIEQSTDAAANAMDMFRLRNRMLEIFKCSQLPSALGDNRQSNPSQLPASAYNNGGSDPRIPQISSHDPRVPTAHTLPAFAQSREPMRQHMHPRADPRQYNQTQAMPAVAGHTAPYATHQQPLHQQHRNAQQPSALMQQQPPTSADLPTQRYYGRGGLRR